MNTENKLQHHLMSTHQLAVIPNYFFRGFECDVFTLNKNLYSTEYEIKKTAQDFKKDFEKAKSKYDWLTQTRSDFNKHKLIEEGKRANRFYFVTPEKLDLIIPDYAGLIIFNESDSFRIIKQAPRLHNNPVEQKDVIHALGNLNWRYYGTTRKEIIREYL